MIDLIRDFIRRCKARRLRLLIVGDAMEDCYIEGEWRVSPEGPVFAETGVRTVCPGGAANVCEAVKHFAVPRLAAPPYWSSKRRLMVGGRCVLRFDSDTRWQLRDKENADLRGAVDAEIKRGVDGVVFSDYAKGALTPAVIRHIIDACNARGIPTVADHKRRSAKEWQGVTVLKMNAAELAACNFDGYHPESMVVTNGAGPPRWCVSGRQGDGPYLPPIHAPFVVGAGDCFAGFLALAMAHGFTVPDAASIAHLAGRAYVRRPFNSAPPPLELLREADPTAAKIVSVDELVEYLRLRRAVKTLVFTNGVWDLTHPGHLHTLTWASRQGDILAVGVNSDNSACLVKGRHPRLSADQRASMLAGLECVDFVTVFDEFTPEKLIGRIRPDVLVKGHEYAGSESTLPGACLAPRVLTAPPSPFPLHSSDLRAAV